MAPSDRIDLGQVLAAEVDAAATVFTRSVEAGRISHPFSSPFGSVTAGGLAEAGWQAAGYVALTEGPEIQR